MADAVTSTTVDDGPRKLVVYLTNTSDGTGEAAVTKVDVSELAKYPDGAGTTCTGVRITKVWYSTVGMGVKILWDATTDVIALQLQADWSDTLDFSSFGGIPNASGSGKTGDIQFTTVGHSSGDTYSIVLEMVKEF